MVTKVLRLNVQDGELEQTEGKLKRVNSQMSKLEGESNNAGNALKKVGDNGGAISTLDALTGGAATRLRDAAEATKLFNLNLKGTRTALLATGIGALVVALGAVVAYWDDIKTFVTGVNQDLETQLVLQKEIGEEADFNLQVLESSENILKLQGKSEQEIINLKKERLKEVIKIAEEELLLQQQQLDHAKNSENTIQGQGERFLKFFGKITFKIAEMLDKATGGIFNFTRGAAIAQVTGASILEGLFGNEEEVKGIEKNIDDLTLKITKARDRLAAIELSSSSLPTHRFKLERVATLPVSGLTGLVELNSIGNKELETLTGQQTERTQLEKEQAEAREKIAEQEAIAKMEWYKLAAEGFAVAARIAGEETAAGKAFAVASTLVSTYTAAQQAYLSQFFPVASIESPIRGKIAAGIAVASGLANVKQILSVPIPGGRGAAVSISSPSNPPAFNIIDPNPENQLKLSLLERKREPIEAFVIDKNVTSAQMLRRNAIKASSF
ncbi:MAG: hypothetical protein AAF090_16140 [Bacteroidota bacterium]